MLEDTPVKAKLLEDIKTTMKARDQKKLTVLRGLNAAIKQVEIDTRTELKDEQIKDIIQKEIKKRRDTIKFAKDAGRTEIVEDSENEIALLSEYLGKQLSEQELGSLIQKIIADGADNIGKVMGALNKDYKGQFDGRLASELIKSNLEG